MGKTHKGGYVLPAVAAYGRQLIVKEAVKRLKSCSIEFDAIAFRGMSGALIAPCIADALGKEIICVRNPSTQSHSDYRVEGLETTCKYIIVDDFVCVGVTVESIAEDVKQFLNENSELVGVYLYNSWGDPPEGFKLESGDVVPYLHRDRSPINEKIHEYYAQP